MRWNWDFIRCRRPVISASEAAAETTPADKMVMVNGHIRQIQGADISDMEVAGRVRMLDRMQLDHESVCTLGRDRIVFLADRLGEIEALTPDDIGAAIYEVETRWMKPNFPESHPFPSYAQLGERDKRLHREYGAAILALISGAPPAAAPAEDKRVWHDRTALSSSYEEQRTRDGYYRHRLKGDAEWTEGRPPRGPQPQEPNFTIERIDSTNHPD